MTDTSTDIIDNGSDNSQSDDAMTELDPEDNQQTLQQESATELATVVPITMQDNFLRNLCDNVGKHTFSRQNFCDDMRNSWHYYNCFVYLLANNSLQSTSWNSISLTCTSVNTAHCTARMLHLCIWLSEAIELYAIIFDGV